MTTQQVAERYYELSAKRGWIEIQNELYGGDVICQEPEHAASTGMQVITKGLDAVKAKGIARRETIETTHDATCSVPIVASRFFSVVLTRDLTFKNGQRVYLEEIGVFEVKDGKVVLERFFY